MHKRPYLGDGIRDPFEQEEVREVLKFLSLGAKKVNFKFLHIGNLDCNYSTFEVKESGWSLKFRGAEIREVGDGWYYLWLKSDDQNMKFKAVVNEIDQWEGTESPKREFQSVPDGDRQLLKHIWETKANWVANCSVRYNITILD